MSNENIKQSQLKSSRQLNWQLTSGKIYEDKCHDMTSRLDITHIWHVIDIDCHVSCLDMNNILGLF